MNKNIHPLLLLFLFMSALQLSRAGVNNEILWDTFSVGGGVLKKMNVIDEDTAFIAGFDHTLLRSTNAGASWERMPIIASQTKFLDFSFVGDTGFVVGNRSLVLNNEKDGYPDVYADGGILKYVAGEWSVIDISNIGSGDDPSINPNAGGCGELDFTTVETIDQSTAYVGLKWHDYNSGSRVRRSGVFKTLDSGASWTHVYNAEGQFLTSLVFKGDVGFIAGLKVFVKTTNAGASFTNYFPNLEAVADDNIYVQDFTMLTIDEFYITTTSDGILYTNDGGETLSSIGDLAGGNDFIKIDDQTYIVAGTFNDDPEKVKAKVSTDSGITWEIFSPGFTTYEAYGPWNDSIYFLGDANLAVIAVSDIKTKNVSAFTSREISHDKLNKFHAFNNDEAILCANGGVILETRNRGENWEKADIPELPVNRANFDFISMSTSKDGAGLLSARNLNYLDFGSSDVYDYYHPGVMFKTTDYWNSWQVYNAKLIGEAYEDRSLNPGNEDNHMFEVYASCVVDASLMFVYGTWADTVSVSGEEVYHGRVFRSTDGGESWESISEDLGRDKIEAMEYMDGVGYFAGKNILLKSTNNGDVLTDILPNLRQNIERDPFIFDISLANGNHFFVATSRDGIHETFDGGLTFSALNGVSGATDFVAFNESVFFTAGSSSKTLFSSDGGENWSSAYPGSVLYKIGPVWNDKVFALGKGSIYSTPLISFGVDENVAIDETFSDNPNFLKVVSFATNIEVESGEDIIDMCFVYDALGKQVARIEPHASNFVINSANYDKGMYIILAISGNHKFTQKIIIR